MHSRHASAASRRLASCPLRAPRNADLHSNLCYVIAVTSGMRSNVTFLGWGAREIKMVRVVPTFRLVGSSKKSCRMLCSVFLQRLRDREKVTKHLTEWYRLSVSSSRIECSWKFNRKNYWVVRKIHREIQEKFDDIVSL